MLVTFLVRSSNENPLSNANKVIDSPINEEAFEKKLDEKTPSGLDTSGSANDLVVIDRAGVGVSETLTDVLSAWLDTLGLIDVESVDECEILLLRFDIIDWGDGKYDNKIYIQSSTKNSKTLHCCNYILHRRRIFKTTLSILRDVMATNGIAQWKKSFDRCRYTRPPE